MLGDGTVAAVTLVLPVVNAGKHPANDKDIHTADRSLVREVDEVLLCALC